jgi:Sec-independent protein secretion pathway component TatC
MFNIDENRSSIIFYYTPNDWYIKVVLYLLGAVVGLEIFRQQIPEIILLQLVPGFYLLLVLLVFIFFFIVLNFIEKGFRKIDRKKTWGTKTSKKLKFFSLGIFLLVLAISSFLLVFDNLLPLSLESFNNFGERTIENTWSFQEILNLELTLIFILLLISQFPLFSGFIYNTETNMKILPKYWKILSVISFIGSGIITPTIDGYTQFCFAISAISLYFIILFFNFQRIFIKFNGILSFG